MQNGPLTIAEGTIPSLLQGVATTNGPRQIYVKRSVFSTPPTTKGRTKAGSVEGETAVPIAVRTQNSFFATRFMGGGGQKGGTDADRTRRARAAADTEPDGVTEIKLERPER